jgi:hypothetical protein
MLAGASRSTWHWPPRRYFFPYEHLVAAAFHSPAGNRIQRGRSQRFAGFEAEARVMQGTSNRVVNDKAFGERAVIVRAVRADGEESIADARQQNVLLADPSEQRAAARQRTDGDPEREIGGLWISGVSHRS